MKRRRSIPQVLLRRRLRAFDPAGATRPVNSADASQPRGRLTRAVRRLRETILGVMPNAGDIDAANDSEK